jgi:hypothetical protein
MLELWAMFEDDPGTPNFTSVLVDGAMLEGRSPDAVFEAGARAVGRPLRSMWTTDPASEQGRVAIKAYGPPGYVPIPKTKDKVWRENPIVL